MANHGWMINLSGASVPVYSVAGGGPSTTKIGTITQNESFVEGSISANPWEGSGDPVLFLASNHKMTFGLLSSTPKNLVDFTKYASNGTSWVAVNTLERKVQYETTLYDSLGNELYPLPAGSHVWLTSNGTAGEDNPNFIAVKSVQRPSNAKYTFPGNGFIDLTCNSRWVNVGSILLRKV